MNKDMMLFEKGVLNIDNKDESNNEIKHCNVRGHNDLAISKEGELLIENIKSNIIGIRNNINQVYDNIDIAQISKSPIKPFRTTTTTITHNNTIAFLNEKVNKMQSTIEALQIVNRSLTEELVQLKEADNSHRSNQDKIELIKYQKRYLSEMKEIEGYISISNDKFKLELMRIKSEKDELVNWKIENSAFIDRLHKENMDLRKEMKTLAERYDHNINILKLKLNTLKDEYDNSTRDSYSSPNGSYSYKKLTQQYTEKALKICLAYYDIIN